MLTYSNSAGAGGVGPLLEFDPDQASQVFQTNVCGLQSDVAPLTRLPALVIRRTQVIAPLRLTQLVAKHMLVGERPEHGSRGLIVNIGSV